EYLVQADEVSGYVTDEIAVVTVGSNYAVLQPTATGLGYNFEYFQSSGLRTSDQATKAQNFARANERTNVYYPPLVSFDTTVFLQYGVYHRGTSNNNGQTNEYEGTVWSFSVSDSTINLVEATPEGGTGQDRGVGMIGILIEALTPAAVGVSLPRASTFSETLFSVIGDTLGSQESNYLLDVGIQIGTSVFNRFSYKVTRCKLGARFFRDAAGTTTTEVDNGAVQNCHNGILIDEQYGGLWFNECVIDVVDSIGIRVKDGGRIWFNNLYTESCPRDSSAFPVMSIGETGNNTTEIFIRGGQFRGPKGKFFEGQELIEINFANKVSITDSWFRHGTYILSTTANTQSVDLISCLQTNTITNPITTENPNPGGLIDDVERVNIYSLGQWDSNATYSINNTLDLSRAYVTDTFFLNYDSKLIIPRTSGNREYPSNDEGASVFIDQSKNGVVDDATMYVRTFDQPQSETGASTFATINAEVRGLNSLARGGLIASQRTSVWLDNTGNYDEATGRVSDIRVDNNSGGQVDFLYHSIYREPTVDGSATGTQLESGGLYIQDQGISTSNQIYAVRIADQTQSGSYAIKTGTGIVEFGGDVSFAELDTLQTQAQQFESNYTFTPFAYTGLDTIPVDTSTLHFVVDPSIDAKTV
ncbi:MAG: hypothetical protein HRU12_20630, partial [Phaeodactylibacter sp.]|nr:hypothetical protein [Phaeodactylibacter sp.]